MITLFTTAKPFSGETGRRQYNALKSWKSIHADVEILLFGDGEGYEKVAVELGIKRLPEIAASDQGCPRIDAMFSVVELCARYPVRAYLNCDIILSDNVLSAIKRVDFPRYLVVAQRRELIVESDLFFSEEEKRLFFGRTTSESRLQDPSAIDMFLYRGDIWTGLPELVVGRGGYDNFLIYFCRRNKVPVIDATAELTLVHQIHDYGHLPGGSREVFQGNDAKANFQKAGVLSNLFTIVHADWLLVERGLLPNRCRGDWKLWAQANRSLLGRVTVANSSWRALLVDVAYELLIRCRPEYGNRLKALLKYPAWALSRLTGRR